MDWEKHDWCVMLGKLCGESEGLCTIPHSYPHAQAYDPSHTTIIHPNTHSYPHARAYDPSHRTDIHTFINTR